MKNRTITLKRHIGQRFLMMCCFCLACGSPSLAADVVVLDDSTYVESSLTAATSTHRVVLYIPNAKRKEAASWVNVMEKTRKLKSFSAIFADANGKILKKLKKSDLQMTEISSDLAHDSYTYYTNYMPASFPFTVTYEWTDEVHDGVIAYPTFVPQSEEDEVVKHASYTIKCSTENPCRYKMVNCESLQGKCSVKTLADGSVKATFDNLPALKKEPYSLLADKRFPMISFAPDSFSYLGTQGRLDTWTNFGKWQYDLLEGQGELPDALRQKIHAMTDNLPSKRAKIARLYQYLYDNTRYVSIQLGIGGYQPAKASEVATLGFGDCKGLSNYMVALLREVGIPAIYVAISTKYADLLEDFPNLNQLNHAIVAVPMEKDTLWLECTNARIPLGYVHEEIAGHQAVLITPEGGKVVRLPRYADADNVQESLVKMSVDAFGKVRLSCRIHKTNRQYETLLPILLMDAEKRQKTLLPWLNFAAAQVDKLSLEEEKDKACADIIFEASSDKYANVSGKRIFIPVNSLKAGYDNISNDENRKNPFFVDWGYRDEEDIMLSLPDGYQVEAMPLNKEINNQFASFKVTYRKEGNQVHAHFRVVMHEGTFDASDFAEFVKTKNLIAKAYRQHIVLVKS